MSLRKQALAAGESTYFTGNPCPNGHIAPRYAKHGGCVSCAKIATDEWRRRKKEHIVDYRKRNRSRDNVKANDWRKANPEKAKESVEKWRKANPEKANLYAIKRKLAKDKRTPMWLTPIDQLEMESIYAYCSALRKCGLDYHVDHIVPLRGTIVSGLHVPWNLQVIPAFENRRKSNEYGV